MGIFRKENKPVLQLGSFPPPPLPSLASDIYRKAFTSRKLLAGPVSSRFEYDSDFVDNDRLEYLGDAVLYETVANYLYTKYPRLRVHYLSMIRQQLVKNETLAAFTRMYHLESALEFEPGMEALRTDTKTQADAFEAYVGSAQVVLGREAVSKWIESLVEPYAEQLHDFYKNEQNNSGSSSAVGNQDTLPVQELERPKTKRFAICGITIFQWNSQASSEHEPLLGVVPVASPPAVTSRQPKAKAMPSTPARTPQNPPSSIGSCTPKSKNMPTSTPQQRKPIVQNGSPKGDALEFADLDKLQCLLCQRQFKNLDHLVRHNGMSEMHQQNLQDSSLKLKAAQTKIQLNSPATTKSKARSDILGADSNGSSPAPKANKLPVAASSSSSSAKKGNVATPAKPVPKSVGAKKVPEGLLTQGGVSFPAQIFDSMPNLPDDPHQRYFLLSCSGPDCQIWYSAVFDARKKLIGHALGESKHTVIEAALAASKTSTVKPLSFVFNNERLPIPPIETDLKSPPGAMTRLLQHLRHPTKARVAWLSWFASQSNVWKDVCLVDGEFKSSGKQADPKSARKASCEKAVDELMAA